MNKYFKDEHLNQKGLSVGELVIAMGIVMIVSLIGFQLMNDSQKFITKVEVRIDNRINTLLADKVILKDFRQAHPSVNQINLNDINDNNFFDYTPDQNSAFYINNPIPGRYLKLDDSNQSVQLYLLVNDLNKGESIYSQPVNFYDISAPPTDINAPATLTFNPGLFTTFIQGTNPKIDSTTLLYIESTAMMKATTTNKISRPAVFIGFLSPTLGLIRANLPASVVDTNIYSETLSATGVITELIESPANFDEYLRMLPPLGTGGSDIRIMPIKVVKYRLKCGAVDNCDLYRSELNKDGTFASNMMVINKLKSVTFHRETIKSMVTSVIYDQNKDLK